MITASTTDRDCVSSAPDPGPPIGVVELGGGDPFGRLELASNCQGLPQPFGPPRISKRLPDVWFLRQRAWPMSSDTLPSVA